MLVDGDSDIENDESDVCEEIPLRDRKWDRRN